MPIDTSTLTPQQQITAIYVAYYDRAPDPAGLQFWVDQLEGGRSLEQIATDFSGAAETLIKYPYFDTPDVASANAFITGIYINLFGRSPDVDGKEFWSNQLESGSTPVGEIILAIIEGAQDTAEGDDLSTIQNKIDAGLDWATDAAEAGVGTSTNLIAEEIDGQLVVNDQAAFDSATSILDNVTGDPATVADAATTTDAFFAGLDVVNLDLTTGADTGPDFTGTDGDDVFNAPLDLAIDGLVGAQTLQGPDVLDGGEGFDVLNAELNGTGTTQNPTISNIEQYNLTSYAGLLGGAGLLNLGRATGYQELWNRDSRLDLTVEEVGEVAALGMENVRDGSVYNVDYDNIAVDTQVVIADRSGAAGNNVELDIDGVAGVINNLELNVSNGVFLDLDDDAADMLNLTIAGSGVLDLTGANEFNNLMTLDSLGYDGDLMLDISGSETLESVMTGEGNDAITAAASNFTAGTAPTSVDLGLGDNTLTLNDNPGNGIIDSAELSALDFTLAPVSNVQTLGLDDVQLDADASLSLEGVGGLETLEFSGFSNTGGDDLAIDGSPEALTITTANEIEMTNGLFTIEGAVDLVVSSTGPEGSDSDIRLDGGVNSETLQTLSVDAADDADLLLEGGTDALTTVDVVAQGDDADVEINDLGALGDEAEFGSLNTVNVTAANDATLNMTGRSGIPAFAGTQATQSFTIGVTGGAPFGGLPFPGSQTLSSGDVVFTSSDIPGGVISTDYSTQVGFYQGANSGLHDAGAASDIAADLDALAELEATDSGNTVNVTWADVGVVEELQYFAAGSGATDGSLDGVSGGGSFVQGQEAIAQVDGEGFEAVETVSVDAQDGDADVNLTDVYGAFTLDVTATDNADVDLFNTNATTATVAAGTDSGDTATITVGGDVVGNANLADLTVSGDMADVTLEDNLDSFTTLDVSGVATDVIADTSAAVFGVAGSEFVEYQIGATSDDIGGTTDVDFTGNDAREIYNFVGDDIGEVVITDFTVGADPTSGDRLDLSDFAASSGELVFTDVGADLVITDLNGGLDDFGGSITVVGAAGDAADMSSFNIIYA